ncbi:hypothetical protein Tco_1016751 [Tanacetum coccineum]|uniref:Uncharacterized protein n=1 Tax=Tanacetum coccineum TaxID=301880 RepID=A0ABQ5FPI6_9ASTR
MKQEGLIRHYGILQKMEDSTRYAKEENKINIKDLLEKDKDYDLKRFKKCRRLVKSLRSRRMVLAKRLDDSWFTLKDLLIPVIITMVNVFPLDHVDDLPEVEPNQPNLALAILEPALVDENEEPEEEEFEEDEFEEEEPQEEEDMEVDIREEENEPELTFPNKEVDPLNPSPPASNLKSEDVVEVEDMVKPKDETVPNSVHAIGESSTVTFLRENGNSLLPSFMRRDINSLFGQIVSLSRRVCIREMAHALVKKKGKEKDKYYGKLISDLGNEVRSSVEERVTGLENLVRKFSNAEERVECKKLKRELEEAGLSNTLLLMQNKRVERDLYWARF